jgi:hypothetical protein
MYIYIYLYTHTYIHTHVNRLITANCPHIAAPYFGDCIQDGQRWLVWKFEANSQTLADLILQAHTHTHTTN